MLELTIDAITFQIKTIVTIVIQIAPWQHQIKTITTITFQIAPWQHQ